MHKKELAIRKQVWLRHGCPVGSIYGDDGEMQCNKCGIDFKRETLIHISARLLQESIKKRYKNDE